MNSSQIFGRGISFPMRIDGAGRMVWSEGEINIRESIHIILLTQFNERINSPDFGGNLVPFLFEPNTVATRFLIQDHISTALARWERRIKVQAISVELDPDDSQAAIATITYKLVATQVVERTTLTITLAG